MATTQEQKDIIEIKGEIGRIRHHQDLQKQVNETTTKLLIEIKNSLKGSDMNGNSGLVDDVKGMKTKQEQHDDLLTTHKVYFRFIGFIVTTISIALVTLMLKIFTKTE